MKNLFDLIFFNNKLEKEMNLKKNVQKFWVLKIAGNNYTSIPVLLSRSDQDRVAVA